MDGTTYPLEDLGSDARLRSVEARDGSLVDVKASTDGRSLRRERNREAVIVALLDLIRGGDFEPGTGEIAERAGVSHRSVFRYFDDLSDLVRAAIDHAVTEVMPMAEIPDMADEPVDHRIAVIVDTLIRVYNHTYEIGRVARSRSLFIPAIDGGIGQVVLLLRGRLADHFAPELSTLDAAVADDLLDSVQLICGFESFDLLRRRLGRTDDQIRRTWRSALSSLLAS